jgi:O-antigen/teichoic acid export membrane protein
MDQNFVRRFLKGSFLASSGTLSTLVFHFMSVSLMSRFVPQEILGLYFLIVAIATAGKILASMGLDITLVHFLASEGEETKQQAFAAIIWLRMLTVASMGLLMYFGAAFLFMPFDAHLLDYRGYLVILFALMSLRELFFYLLQGLQLFKPYALLQAASAIFRFSLIFMLRDSLTLTNLLLIDFASLGGSFLVQFYFLPFTHLFPAKFSFDMSFMRRIFRYGLPLYSNSMLTYVSDFGGTYLVGIFLSPLGIASYEIARKIPDGFRRLFSAFHTVYFPNLSSLFAKRDLKNAEKFLNYCLNLLGVGAFALTLFSLLFSRELILFLAPENYLEVQPTFVLIMFAVCLQLLSGTMGYSLVSLGQPGYSTRVNIVAMGLEFALSLLFVPYIGYLGIGISYVFMCLISQIACYFFLRRAGVVIDLGMFIRPLLILMATSLAYVLIGDEGLPFKLLILLSYTLLSLAFVPESRQALAYFWALVQTRRLRAESA